MVDMGCSVHVVYQWRCQDCGGIRRYYKVQMEKRGVTNKEVELLFAGVSKEIEVMFEESEKSDNNNKEYEDYQSDQSRKYMECLFK